MEPWHGRRGKDATGSIVCGRAHRNTLFMVAMVATLAVVLLRESTPIEVAGGAQSPVLKVPVSVFEESADSSSQWSFLATPRVSETDEGPADLTNSDVSPVLEETEPEATVLEASPSVEDELQEAKPNTSAIVAESENTEFSPEESISTSEKTTAEPAEETSSAGEVAGVDVPLPENATISEAFLTTEEKDEILLEAKPDELVLEEAGFKGVDAIEGDAEAIETETEESTCDYSVGKWVLDDTRPLYSGNECKLWLSEGFSCRLHAHPDKLLDKYRWQPAGCNLPVFNSSSVLEMLRNKVVAFVGDSLGRQQFQSLMCMLTRGQNDTAISDVGADYGMVKARFERKPSAFAYRFDATNTTFIYKWSVTLARIQAFNASDPVSPNALHLDRPELLIEELLPIIDVLMLNSGHHWNNGKMRQNRFEFHLAGKPVKKSEDVFQVASAYNATVHNILGWIHNATTATPEKIVYYRSLSPRHFRNGDWDTGGTCDVTTIGRHHEVEEAWKVDPIAESAVMGTTVNLLNITSLSLERGETHVSKYGGGKGGQDCLHWCLPGIPDTWNEVFLASLATKLETRREFVSGGST